LAEFVGGLLLVALLASGCVLAPFAAAILTRRVWVGVPVALGSFWVWGRFGPRPMPGFLNGILCLCGYAALLGSLIGWVVLAVLH
jgi:hypothetical protein